MTPAKAIGTTTEEHAEGGSGGDNDDQDDQEEESDGEDGSDDGMHLAGFYRSRFLQGGATKIFILAIPKANDTRNKCILWRPNTGRSPFEEDWSELVSFSSTILHLPKLKPSPPFRPLTLTAVTVRRYSFGSTSW